MKSKCSSMGIRWCVSFEGDEKRQRTAALQDASRLPSPSEIPTGFGVRQSSAAFDGSLLADSSWISISAFAVQIDQDIPRLGAFARAYDPAILKLIHYARGAGVTQTQAALH